jgi:hypothetical protein
MKPGQGSGRNIQIRVRVIERRSRPGVIKKGGGEDSRPNPNPTPSIPRMCGVNPNLLGEMTLDQGGQHGPVHHKSCTINPECSGRWGSPLYGCQRAEGRPNHRGPWVTLLFTWRSGRCCSVRPVATASGRDVTSGFDT